MGVVCLNLDLDEVAVLRRVLAGALLTIQPTGDHESHAQIANPDIQMIYAMIGDLDRLLGRQRSPRRRMLAPVSLPDGNTPGPRLLRGDAPGS